MDWTYKAALTATSVALLLKVAQMFGRRAAGILAGLPTVTGPALVWLALEFGGDYATLAAVGSVAACAMCAVFALAYDYASRVGGIPAALGLATGTSLLAALPLHWASTGVLVALAISAVVSVVVFSAMPEGRERAEPAHRLRGELALTALVSGAVSGAVAASAPAVGPFWAGVLASPPLIAAAVAMHQHAFVGHASVRRFLRGYVAGLLGRAVFAAGFAWLLASIGATSAALLAAIAGCTITTVLLRLWSLARCDAASPAASIALALRPEVATQDAVPMRFTSTWKRWPTRAGASTASTADLGNGCDRLSGSDPFARSYKKETQTRLPADAIRTVEEPASIEPVLGKGDRRS